MESIEDILGSTLPKDKTREEWADIKRDDVMRQMALFDELPLKLRTFINNSDYPYAVDNIVHWYRYYGYDVSKTIKEVKRKKQYEIRDRKEKRLLRGRLKDS